MKNILNLVTCFVHTYMMHVSRPFKVYGFDFHKNAIGR